MPAPLTGAEASDERVAGVSRGIYYVRLLGYAGAGNSEAPYRLLVGRE